MTDETIDVIQTWGTGSMRRTMAINIKKKLYFPLGWKIGDFLMIEVDDKEKKLVISKMDGLVRKA